MLSNVTYSPSHLQAGTPTINIQSTFHTDPDLYKNVSLHRYMVATIIHIRTLTVCTQSDICACVFFFYYLFTTCSITKQYYMFKCSFDSLAVLLISS